MSSHEFELNSYDQFLNDNLDLQNPAQYRHLPVLGQYGSSLIIFFNLEIRFMISFYTLILL